MFDFDGVLIGERNTDLYERMPIKFIVFAFLGRFPPFHI